MSCCEKQTESLGMSEIVIDFLYLDDETCAPCSGTEAALDRAVEMLQGPMSALGVALKIRKTHMVDRKTAIAHAFLSSPTIRVNGVDIDPARTEDDCPSCGSLTGNAVAVDCRTWHWRGKVYKTAPVGKIVEDVLAARGSADASCEGEPSAYTMPDNLESFFAARETVQNLDADR